MLWIFINQVTAGNLCRGASAEQWKGSTGSDHCGCGGISAASSFFFLLLKDPLEGEPEGPHRAGTPAPPYKEIDEGFDAAEDADEQEKILGRHRGVTELLQEIAEDEEESEEHNDESNDVSPLWLLLLGATPGLDDFDCEGNDHGCSKEEQDDGVDGDVSCPAVLLLM